MHTELTWSDPRVAAELCEVREQRPLVQCLTNIVVAQFTANALLAVGASPAMVENAKESAEFTAVASAVLINLGTLSAEREVAMRAAATAAHDHGRPWVFDPVAVGVLGPRPHDRGMQVEELPGSEFGGRGVDSLAQSDEALGSATVLARARSCVVAVSGLVDYVTDGINVIEVPGGSALLTRITGTGCALGALVAAFVAVDDDVLFAAAAASAVFKAAGECAARNDPGTGTFGVALMDALDALTRGARPRLS